MDCLALLIGWAMDLLFGDPVRLPHPIVCFGRAIAWCERTFNHGLHRKVKGGICAVSLILLTYCLSWLLIGAVDNLYLNIAIQSLLVFYCLSGTTLIREVRAVFVAADRSLDDGRRQVGRIVGRDTSRLTDQEVRTAALETLAENLSDGVVAPLFWYAVLGVPGMMAYKMVNTLDSMIGYRNDRYRDFGCVAARIDDAANYLPARITSFLMVICGLRPRLLGFVREYGPQHLSPNSGYPEAALAGLLDCRFGGPHDYFGVSVYKPYIGVNPRPLSTTDMAFATSINRRVELLAVALTLVTRIAMCTSILSISV